MEKKKLFENKKVLVFLLFIAITIISFFLRFWRYETVVNFYLDPPFHLHEVKDMVETGKIRLIGPMVETKVIEGRGFFTGPFYYWVLAILGIVFNWNVILITGFFSFLWMGTFILIYFWLKERFDEDISLSAYAVLSFLPILISHSRMIWNPHFLPLFLVFLLWFLEKREKGKLFFFLAGLAFGLGIHFEYMAFLWLLVIFYYLIKDIRAKSFLWIRWVLFFVGVIVAESPLILFELRHDFYNLRTFIFQIENFELSAGYTFLLPHYYWFPFVPLISKFYCLFLETLKRFVSREPVVFLEIVLAGCFLIASLLSNQKLTFSLPHWDLEKQKRVTEMIIADDEKTFEVASLIGPDTRAFDLRWWLRERGYKPLGVEEYNQAVVLYLVAPESRSIDKETVWEIQSLRPFKTAKQVDIGDGYVFYKLRRNPLEK